MTGIEPLVSTADLKSNLLMEAKTQPSAPIVHFDRPANILIMQVVPLEIETVVHYVDNHVGPIYQADDLEIVGIQVEDFARSFLAKHDAVNRIWKLSNYDQTP